MRVVHWEALFVPALSLFLLHCALHYEPAVRLQVMICEGFSVKRYRCIEKAASSELTIVSSELPSVEKTNPYFIILISIMFWHHLVF